MVHRKRSFTEIDGQKLLDATETFGRALFDAQRNAPLSSEIFTAIDALSGAVRHVQVTLTGDPEYGWARAHSTHNNLPPKKVKLRTWDTIPLWKRQESKK
jgi:hypothetical protein